MKQACGTVKPGHRRYSAVIWTEQHGRNVHLGSFEEFSYAGQSYDLVAIKCMGQAAVTVFPRQHYARFQHELDSRTLDLLLTMLRAHQDYTERP
ncbi:hypothetical protein PLESTF_001893200 [Pleodorina starrii]|nr:hypothetical protein PLESTF_001893200 [Pleodorina starrii]